ncbi:MULTISPECIES: cysteine desulfurase family protein [Croceibacter]|jgi:cysteine desulfurase|uniref:cysteine desulfurase family protein n=1 Tax=Croceibacter TaxID=216431 RepID=UPI000C53A17C|nr:MULTISPECIES: cysteine desulfurase family protein [Croceibacter]MBG24680.1 cysteine desulfurase [Croceibacter sp.]WSP33759.1 cysteine desulfurase family protein [Croceibacter atlanticus]HAT70636.1 cysteine desulfurase [Flavobacteriaceae bacterium]|tara:strand:+ start:5916 stop:7064 length:1149 start_codon:yes stop_codon:yes gene_type:complete
MRKVYFDSAATTQVRKEVIEKMTQVMSECYGNPSSTHAFGRAAKTLIEQARKDVAKHLNVSAGEIIFTSGGTEADNLAICSSVKDLGVTRIITSRIEHHAVLHTVQEMQDKHNVTVDYVNLKDCGSIDSSHLEELLGNSTEKTLVSLMHINNEVGNMLDIKAVAKLCKSHNALFHCDTVQSVGHFKLDFSEIPVDFTAVSAHKFHGPKGVGFAFIRKNSGLKPMIVGGSQERGIRAGTESVHNIVGLSEALNISYANLEEEKAYIKSLKQYFKDQLQEHIPEASLNGGCSDNDNSTYTLLNVCLPIAEEKAVLLLFQLDLNGIACSKGSACQSGSGQASHVLQAILEDDKLKRPSVRFSFSKYNTKEEIDYVIGVLKNFMES